MNESDCVILTVDDNKENLRVVSNFLKDKGYQIALSLNTENAWSILQSNKVDLILLDVMMPGENGYDLCRRIKKESAFNEIPVIFLTARTETDDLVEGFNAGGVDYITKPFRKEELLARVKNHIDLAIAKRNITMQAELIMQMNRTRDKMYAIISHDIKSPFANISMMISLIAEGYLDPGSEDFKEIIHNLNFSTKETYTLLENLLQWTRTQTGDIKCHAEIVSLNDLIRNSISFLSGNAEHKRINFNQKMPDDVELNVDQTMIKSVFRNVISNAIKFSQEGGTIEITTKEEDGWIHITITDFGVGMDKNQLDGLFKEDVFVTTPGTNNEKGSGLGLHLINDFTRRNGGTISVNSEPEKGTIFLLRFPVYQRPS